MASLHLFLAILHLASFHTMRSAAALIPALLTSQLPGVAAWVHPAYGHPGSWTDAGHDELGAVASESSICSDIGTNALKAGGNAADSLVATTFCVGVIGMYHR